VRRLVATAFIVLTGILLWPEQSLSSFTSLEVPVIQVHAEPDAWRHFAQHNTPLAAQIKVRIDNKDGIMVYHGNPRSLRKRRKRKYSYRIKTGDETLVLKTSVFDRSLIREWLGLKIFSMAGIISPEAKLVRLYINGKKQGFYVLIRPVDKKFIFKHFPEIAKYTSLFYGDPHTGPGINISPDFTPAQTSQYRYAYTPVISGVGSYRKLTELFVVLNSNPFNINRFSEIADLEEWVRWFSVSEIVENKDSPWSSSERNFTLYWSPDKKWQILPWDMDLIYRGKEIFFPVSRVKGLKRLTGNELFIQMKKLMVYRLITGVLSTDRILGLIDEMTEQIQPYIQKGEDPFVDYQRWMESVQKLKEIIRRRHNRLLQMLHP